MSPLSVFEKINQRAEQIKADKWKAYRPLTPAQLTDDDSEFDLMSLDVGVFGKFVVIHRQTENKAAKDRYRGKSETRVRLRGQRSTLRWCILCECRHPVRAFYRDDYYLHGLSYACKKSIRKLKMHRWHA